MRNGIRDCQWIDAGLVPYEEAWAWQKQWVEERKRFPDCPDLLCLLEHPAVYTLGQASDMAFVKFAPGEAKLVRIERGGEVTYHAPGQLVGYPILNLIHYRQDLHWYLRQLEEVVIQTVGHFGLVGERLEGLTGVWIEGVKVAAIGIKVSRWITMHGFALNICPDMTGFSQIVPCGIADRPVGRLVDWVPELGVKDVVPIVVQEFGNVFGIQMEQSTKPTFSTKVSNSEPFV
jgi:lipoyl(octanoyl) transferase